MEVEIIQSILESYFCKKEILYQNFEKNEKKFLEHARKKLKKFFFEKVFSQILLTLATD